MRRTACLSLLSLVMLGSSFFGTGCGSSATDEVDNGFESDDPRGDAELSGSREGAPTANAGSPAPSAGEESATGDSATAQRAIEEADIVRTEGNRLYALSRYGGLTIVDTSNPAALKLLGRKRLDGTPFEMYFRNGKVVVMLNEFGRYETVAGSPYGRWVDSSEIVELDVANPAAINQVASFSVPGSIADSRLVGDALYVVTYENGSCWGCGTKPATLVTSFLVGSSIAKVEQLPFVSPNAGYSSWQRSVAATNERLYVAGPEWNWNGGSGGHSVVQVVDIHDPNGHMVKGADIPVDGQIQSRWQMDELDGVFRVVSQNGNGWGNGVNPRVETFAIDNSQSFRKLGQTDLVLPKPESLRSVRFDGTRAYAITAERSDPLFTIDLSDPAKPRQAGELHMPGWITHLEPRGDRLIGFGFEDTNWQSQLAVSLFDVSNLSNPTLIKRVAFGGGGGQYAEDPDRIHKSVRVLDAEGLVLVPFASYGRWSGSSCTPGQSGIQLIDFSRNDLVLRGIAPQHGQPRRAILSGNHVLGVSDRTVSAFDISNRAAPTKASEIDLANPAYRMTQVGASLASITSDWWTNEVMLSITPKAGADDAAVSGKLSLASLAGSSSAYCGAGGSWADWYSARLFAMGNQVIVALPVRSYDGSTSSSKLVIGVVDASNPATPTLVKSTEVALASSSNGYYGWGFFDGYGFYSFYGGSVLGGGESMVQVGSKLAFLENEYERVAPSASLPGMPYVYTPPTIHRRLHVIDFANPAAPEVRTPVQLGDSRGTFPLVVAGSRILSSRWVNGAAAGKVKFFVDRVELGGALPARLPSVNSPGSLVTVDGPTGRYVTADYARRAFPAADYSDCSQRTGYRGRFSSDTGLCATVDRSFKLVDVDDTELSVRSTYVPPSQNIGGIDAGDDRVHVTHYATYRYDTYPQGGVYQPPTVLEQGGMWTLGGLRDGNLRLVNEMVGDSKWPLAVAGKKVALYTEGGLSVYDTSREGVAPELVGEAKLRGWGYSSHVMLENDRAICSLGEYGIQTVAVRP